MWIFTWRSQSVSLINIKDIDFLDKAFFQGEKSGGDVVSAPELDKAIGILKGRYEVEDPNGRTLSNRALISALRAVDGTLVSYYLRYEVKRLKRRTA
jgi:hypothetical protein